MYRLKVTLLVSFIIANNIQNAETKETLYYASIPEQEAVHSLVEIEAYQVLPLVQLLNNSDMSLMSPRSLEEVFIDKGRIINRTRFASQNETTQLLFCPKENSQRNCLAPKEFQGLEPLECAKEPQFQAKIRENISCGAESNGTSKILFYEICPSQKPIVNETKEIKLYEVCCEKVNGGSIFTKHLIGYPELLDSKALRQERSVKFGMELSHRISSPNIRQLMDVYSAVVYGNRHIYRMQKLTPPEDLAFGLSKKSTYRHFNTKHQHETLHPLWNEINENIRNEAGKMYVNEGVRFEINTGVFDLPPNTLSPVDQMSNMWVKLIYAKASKTGELISGMVILMNNFINDRAEATTSSEKKTSIIQHCQEDLCEDELKKKFEDVGGSVSCCSVSERLKNMFRWQDDDTATSTSQTHIQILRIPGINGIVENSMDELQ